MIIASTYKWTHPEILYGLTIRQFVGYLNGVSIIEARQQLHRFEAAGYPYMKDSDREKVNRRYDFTIKPSTTLISDPKEVEKSWNMLRTGKWQLKAKT